MMRRMIEVGLLAGLFLVAFATEGLTQASAPNPEGRQGARLVEGVAAVVGDRSIMLSEVEEQFEVLAPQYQIDPGDSSQANQLRREILDDLVNRRLLSAEAEALGLRVDQAQVDQEVEVAIRADRERLGDAGFARQLAAEGLTETQLRSTYADGAREEILRRQLLQKEVFSKISIADTQVQRHFEENREKIGKRPRTLRVLDLFVRTTADSLVEKTYYKRAMEIREEIVAGLAFEEAVKRYSDDQRAADRGGSLGRFSPGEVGDRSFDQVLFGSPIGEVSMPVRTNLGYHLVQVVDRDPNGRWAQARHVLVGVATSRSDTQRTRLRAQTIREEIVSGGLDFATAVRRYSDDAASRDLGGDVGWLAIDNFLGETRQVVESLRVGDVSEIAAVEGGFHIFKLNGEQAESDYTFEEIRDEMRNIVETEERQRRFDSYVAELREKTYVEIRPIQ